MHSEKFLSFLVSEQSKFPPSLYQHVACTLLSRQYKIQQTITFLSSDHETNPHRRRTQAFNLCAFSLPFIVLSMRLLRVVVLSSRTHASSRLVHTTHNNCVILCHASLQFKFAFVCSQQQPASHK